MIKKRLIFNLFFQDGYFVLSRNFRLQRVGDVNWINKNYNFSNISKAIDELVILNVSRNEEYKENFFSDVREISKSCFMPVCIGGRINSLEDAKICFENGADKVVINTALYKNKELVKSIVRKYGAQAVVASVDCRRMNRELAAFVDRGKEQVPEKLSDYLEDICKLDVGEIMINSIDKDGTGQGYDNELVSIAKEVTSKNSKPLIITGGAGNYNHFLEYINDPHVDAVSTGNLLNFIGPSLKKSREALLVNKANIANFNYSGF